jgi:hypothetical protein
MDVLELPRPVINFLRTMSKEMHRYALCWDIFGGAESVTLTLTWKMSDGSSEQTQATGTGASTFESSKDLVTAAFASSSNLSKSQPSSLKQQQQQQFNKSKEKDSQFQSLLKSQSQSQSSRGKQMQHSRLDAGVTGSTQKHKSQISNINFNMKSDYASNSNSNVEPTMVTTSGGGGSGSGNRKSSLIKRAASNLKPTATAHVKAALLSARGALLPASVTTATANKSNEHTFASHSAAAATSAARNLSVDSQYSRSVFAADNARRDPDYEEEPDDDDLNAYTVDNYNYNEIIEAQRPLPLPHQALSSSTRHSSRKASFGQVSEKEKPKCLSHGHGHGQSYGQRDNTRAVCYPSLIQSSIRTSAMPSMSSSIRQRGKSLEALRQQDQDPAAVVDYEYEYDYDYEKSNKNNNKENENDVNDDNDDDDDNGDDNGDGGNDDYGFINLDIVKSGGGVRSSAPSSASASAKLNRKVHQLTSTAAAMPIRSGGKTNETTSKAKTELPIELFDDESKLESSSSFFEKIPITSSSVVGSATSMAATATAPTTTTTTTMANASNTHAQAATLAASVTSTKHNTEKFPLNVTDNSEAYIRQGLAAFGVGVGEPKPSRHSIAQAQTQPQTQAENPWIKRNDFNSNQSEYVSIDTSIHHQQHHQQHHHHHHHHHHQQHYKKKEALNEANYDTSVPSYTSSGGGGGVGSGASSNESAQLKVSFDPKLEFI